MLLPLVEGVIRNMRYAEGRWKRDGEGEENKKGVVGLSREAAGWMKEARGIVGGWGTCQKYKRFRWFVVGGVSLVVVGWKGDNEWREQGHAWIGDVPFGRQQKHSNL